MIAALASKNGSNQKREGTCSHFKPKNERNYFLISALASKNGSNKKIEGTLLYQLGGI